MANGKIRVSTDPSDADGWKTLVSVPRDRWPGIRVSVDKTQIPFGEWRYADEFEGKVEIRGEIGPAGVSWAILKGHVRIVLPVVTPIRRAA